MWLSLAFLSATLLGFYDVFKKASLKDNPVIPVLFLNTLFSTLIFLPFILLNTYTHVLDNTVFQITRNGWNVHLLIILKSCIVLSSWALGYNGIKHLPITIVGPINATRPVLVLIGAMLVFGERLNLFQWIGVALAFLSFFLLSKTGKKEGISFSHNRWIFYIVGAALLGALSGLYDKFLMAPVSKGGAGLDTMMVQSWYNVYQCMLMGIILFFASRRDMSMLSNFRWRWSIVCISVFLCMADFAYFYALSLPGTLISIVSMIRRGSVLVSFFFGAAVFHEKNLKNKAIDLLLVLIGMIFLYIGSK